MKKKQLPKIFLTSSQFSVFSEISRDIAQIFFASMVVPPFLAVDKINWVIILSGGLLSIAFWIMSILLIKKGNNDK